MIIVPISRIVTGSFVIIVIIWSVVRLVMCPAVAVVYVTII